MYTTTPVALFIFRRPEQTRRVFEVIRAVRPPVMLLVADGPRSDRAGEAELCAATRSIVENIDWPCEVLKNYAGQNLGCRSRMASGLTWVFEQVEEAIILEDDCLPHPSFFLYCDELLQRYRNDPRIMHIAGSNVLQGRYTSAHSYYFSLHCLIWGWATWRRAWHHYDVKMQQWPMARVRDTLRKLMPDQAARQYWTTIFQQAYEGTVDTWDYQWTFACWLHQGLSATPGVNLVSNIGFGKHATHTLHIDSHLAALPVHPLTFPMSHPTTIERDYLAEQVAHRVGFRVRADSPYSAVERAIRRSIHLGTAAPRQLIRRLLRSPK